MFAEIGTAIQVVKEAGAIIEKVKKGKEEDNQPLLLVAFDCRKDYSKKGYYTISMEIVNTSNRHLADVNVGVLQNGKVIPLVNSMILQRDGCKDRDILRVIVFVSGDFSLNSMNLATPITPKAILRVQIDGENFDINIDFGIIIANVVGIKYP